MQNSPHKGIMLQGHANIQQIKYMENYLNMCIMKKIKQLFHPIWCPTSVFFLAIGLIQAQVIRHWQGFHWWNHSQLHCKGLWRWNVLSWFRCHPQSSLLSSHLNYKTTILTWNVQSTLPKSNPLGVRIEKISSLRKFNFFGLKTIQNKEKRTRYMNRRSTSVIILLVWIWL